MPVMQFDYAYMSFVNEKGEQVRMRTILDTSTGYGTACVIDVKGGGDKYAISSVMSFLKELGVHSISMQDGSCEGCLVVGCDHGPQAEVAQGVGPGPLVER